MRKKLEDNGSVVFLCDMRNYMNLTTRVEITDFFISIMGALSEEVEEKYNENPAVTGYWDRLVNFMKTEVKFENIKFETLVGPVKTGITASLKDDPDFRKYLQDGLRGHVAKLIKQAHQFATEIVELVREKTNDKNKKVVFLVDSVEQIRGVGDEAGLVYRSVENLFSGHPDALRLPMLHVVYTIPPYLTSLAPSVGRLLGGGNVAALPNVYIRNEKGEDDEDGLNVMVKIVSNRFPRWAEVFNKDQIKRLAISSGGDLRDFFRLIGDSLVKCSTGGSISLPVDESIINNVENHLRRNMLPIAKTDLEWLKKISKSKRPELESIEELPRLARFFDTTLVLNYRNGHDWYDVHPLLHDMVKEE